MNLHTREHYDLDARLMHAQRLEMEARAPRACALRDAVAEALWGPESTGISDEHLTSVYLKVGSCPAFEFEEQDIPDELVAALWQEAMARERLG